MKISFCVKSKYLTVLFLSFFALTNLIAKDSDLIRFYPSDTLTIELGGKFNNESFASNNMNYLNNTIGSDSIFFLRTTCDFFSSFIHGEKDKPRITFFDSLRFRFKWGSNTDVKNDMSYAKIGNTALGVPGTSTNKHLLWMRESWLQVMLGDNQDYKNYIQIGLIPFEVGRGISLGAAYDATSFLCLSPGSSIDQYAPAVLLSLNPIKDRYIADFYLALVENRQTSLAENLAPIHAHEQNACPARGVGRQSFIVALRNQVTVLNRGENLVKFEPYIVHQQAPDQDLEFTNDVDSFISTIGGSIEGKSHRMTWGIEGACNFGDLFIRSWDRNYNQFGVDSLSGAITEQYSLVYATLGDSYPTSSPQAAPHTTAIETLAKSCPQNRTSNGQLIGTAMIDGMTQNIYNAYNRFRPEEHRQFCGFFFVADAAYDCIPKVLNLALGVGFASGYVDEQQDANKLTPYDLDNIAYTGFVPLQSVYSGKRLRHLVLFNQGVPRFNTRLPNADVSQINVVKVLTPDVTNEFTNIAFLGTRVDWKIPSLKKYGVNIAQNIICYWIPDTSHYVISNPIYGTNPDAPLVATEASNNFLGTEFTTEFWVVLHEKIKVYGYAGALVPGQHYQDMCGTTIGKLKLKTGADIGYIVNIGAAYYF